MKLAIRSTSGAERIDGAMVGGDSHDYSIEKDIALALFDKLFDMEVANSKPDNKKSGGMVAQLLHAYGVSASVIAKHGNPFPATGGVFGPEQVETWFEILNAESTKDTYAGQVKRQQAWDTKAAGLKVVNLKPEDFIGKRPQVTAKPAPAVETPAVPA